MSYRYKNRTDKDLVLIGVGVVKAGEVIESDEQIENQNLEPVADRTRKVTKEDGDVS